MCETRLREAASPAPCGAGTVAVRVFRTQNGEGLPLPAYMSPGAAGMDLHAAVESEVLLPPGEARLIGAGIAIALPPGFEAQVRPRSGLALRHGVTVLNAPGTIDSDYRGEIGVILINHGREPFPVRPGDRIAQLVVAPVARAAWEPVDALDATGRGAGGFGSTGGG